MKKKHGKMQSMFLIGVRDLFSPIFGKYIFNAKKMGFSRISVIIQQKLKKYLRSDDRYFSFSDEGVL